MLSIPTPSRLQQKLQVTEILSVSELANLRRKLSDYQQSMSLVDVSINQRLEADVIEWLPANWIYREFIGVEMRL